MSTSTTCRATSHLSIRWNRITGVHHDTWLPVQGTLKRLWFDYNDLVLHDEIFSDLEAVIDIRLQHNPIATTHAILRGPPFIIPLPQDAPVAADKTTCDAQGGTIWSYTKESASTTLYLMELVRSTMQLMMMLWIQWLTS